MSTSPPFNPVFCRRCKHGIPNSATFCEKCGFDQRTKTAHTAAAPRNRASVSVSTETAPRETKQPLKPNWFGVFCSLAGLILMWGMNHKEKPDALNYYPLSGHIYNNVKIYADNPDPELARDHPRLQIGRVVGTDGDKVFVSYTNDEIFAESRSELLRLHLYVYADDPALR